jgi:hypothetical protein
MNRIWRITAFGALTLAVAATSVYAAEPSQRTAPHANEVGIWKRTCHMDCAASFISTIPIGLIAGELIHTDCSINWTDPDDGRVYCFNSATSLVYFENWPKTYSHKAADALERMKKDTPEH